MRVLRENAASEMSAARVIIEQARHLSEYRLIRLPPARRRLPDASADDAARLGRH